MKKRRPARSRTLQCELLESRQMMAASATLTSGVLNVVGTDGDDAIKFFQSGKNIFIQGVAGYWSASKVKSIYVDSKGGDDFVSLNSWANGGNKAIKELTTIIGGAGTDRVSVGAAHDLYFSGQGKYAQVDAKGVARLNGAEVNLASYTTAVLKSGVLTVTGTLGNDNLKFAQVNGNIYITGVAGSFKASKVSSIVVRLQDGNDSVSLHSLANGGNQALLEYVTVYSMVGNDTVRLANGHDVAMNGAHTLQVAPNGTAKLDGVTLSWDPTPQPDPTPDPDPDPTPTPLRPRRAIGSPATSSTRRFARWEVRSTPTASSAARISSPSYKMRPTTARSIPSSWSTYRRSSTIRRCSRDWATSNGWRSTSSSAALPTSHYAGQALGNLAAGSTTAHMTNLVNKWFLGLDRPTAGGTYRQFCRPALRQRRRLHRHQSGPGRRLLLDGFACRSGAAAARR